MADLTKAGIKLVQKDYGTYTYETDKNLSSLDIQANFRTITDSIVDTIQPDIVALETDAASLQAGFANTTAIDNGDTPYTALSTDNVIICDTTAGVITVTLPAVASSTGKTYKIIKVINDANNVTIDGNASETINGATTQTLAAQYDTMTIVCDGSEWFITASIIA